MSNISSPFKNPTILSLVLMIPLLFLELVNSQNINEDFPFLLFVFLWFLPTTFLLILTPLKQDTRAGKDLMTKPFYVIISIFFLALIATIRGAIVVDQMPGFLGVPNCD